MTIYLLALFYLLSINSCLGMITGTPRHSLYSFSVIVTHSTTSDCHNYKVPQLYHPINKFLYSLFDRNKDLFIDNYNLLCLDPHSLQQAVHLSSSTNIYKQIYVRTFTPPWRVTFRNTKTPTTHRPP